MDPQISHLILKNRAIEKIRGFFRNEKIPEVSTPLLVKSGAIEPYLDTFELSSGKHLPTSPEISLKKMMAIEPADQKGIYEIAHAFRNETASQTHLHEFLMVEWYRRKSDTTALARDITAIVTLLASLEPAIAHGSGFSAPADEIEIITLSELFQSVFGATVQPDWGAGEYEKLARQNNTLPAASQQTPEEDRLVGAFSTLFDEAVHRAFGGQRKLIYLKDFPPQVRGMAALNRQGWAERIEAFLGESEIASGYRELADPDELRRLWEANNRLREKLGKKPHPVDEELIALTPHMEGVAGMALGLERTLAAIYGIDEISRFSLG